MVVQDHPRNRISQRWQDGTDKATEFVEASERGCQRLGASGRLAKSQWHVSSPTTGAAGWVGIYRLLGLSVLSTFLITDP